MKTWVWIGALVHSDSPFIMKAILTIHYESNTTAAVRIVSRYFFNIFEWYHLKNAKESQSFYSGLTHPQAKCNSSMLWRKSISKLDGKRTPLNSNNSVGVFSCYHYDNS